MKKTEIVVLGAGISGHTAAMFAKRYARSRANVSVISPESHYNWIPSNIWVGVNRMQAKDVLLPLAPVYNRHGIAFHRGRATELYPEGSVAEARPHIVYESTAVESAGTKLKMPYDFLINATGPKLNFAATPGLGPDGHSYSVCTAAHAEETARHLMQLIKEMQEGAKKQLVVGTGHGTCTCEGAAFEYVFNVDTELRRHGVRENAELIYITNEAEPGDFGVDGMQLEVSGTVTPSSILMESLFHEKGIRSVMGAHVERVEQHRLFYTNLAGEKGEIAFDFAMLLPPFRGNVMQAFDANGNDIGKQLFNANGFMKVDAEYAPKEYEAWKPSDWPRHYQSPAYANIFAIGIAFAPPHAISRPRKNPAGVIITPAPPRTGMPSAMMGRVVAHNIARQLKTGKAEYQSASLAELGAACVASMGTGFSKGAAVSITMFPIVPDYEKYPETGRDTRFTFGDVGRAGHWIKKLLHYLFIYKAKGKLFWWMIPE